MNPILLLVVAIAVSMLVIPLMWRLAPALGMMDKPDPRKVHREPIPRVGGWGITAGALLPLLMVVELDALMQAYVAGALVLFVFGVWDDCREAGHYQKFVGQTVAACLIVFLGGLWVHRLPFMPVASELPAWIGQPFTVFALVGAINATNHSDGLDGLAGGETLLSLLVLGFLFHAQDFETGLLLSACAAGGILGFLRFNTHPARVFMGDSGSQFLGYTVGFLVVLLTQVANPVASAAVPALLLGLPIVDILAVLWLRATSGRSWFKATRNHIHHRLLDLGFAHFEVVVIIYSLQALLVVAGFLLIYEYDVLVLGFYLVVCTGLFLAITRAERRGWRAHAATGSSRLQRSLDALVAHPAFTAVPLVFVAVSVPLFILVGAVGVAAVPRDFGIVSAVLCVMLAGELVLGRQAGTVLIRGTVYVAAVFTVYLTSHARPDWWEDVIWLELALYLGLAVAVWITIRYGMRGAFETSPMDYLVVFGVLGIAIFAGRQLQVQQTGSVIVKAIVLLYGCEALIMRIPRRYSPLTLATVAGLGILGVRGLTQ